LDQPSERPMPDKPELPQQRRRMRTAFIVRLYEIVDASVSEFVNAYEIANAIGMDENEARRVVEYFEEKGYLKVDDHRSGVVRITVEGIDHVEDLSA